MLFRTFAEDVDLLDAGHMQEILAHTSASRASSRGGMPLALTA